MTGRPASILRDRSGAAAAEMALILPLVLILMITVFDGARFMWCEHLVIKGVRDGARYAGRLPYSTYGTTDPNTGAFSCGTSALSGTPLSNIQNLTRAGELSDSAPSRISGWVKSDVKVTYDCLSGQGGIYNISGTAGNAPRVKVSTAVSFPVFFGALGFNINPLKIAATAESPVAGI